MRYTVTCDGSPWKIGTHSECVAFIAVQKRKIKGAGLCSPGSTPAVPANAAQRTWAIRPEVSTDRLALLGV